MKRSTPMEGLERQVDERLALRKARGLDQYFEPSLELRRVIEASTDEERRAAEAAWRQAVADRKSPEMKWAHEIIERALQDRVAIPALRDEVRRSGHPGGFAMLEVLDILEGRAPHK